MNETSAPVVGDKVAATVTGGSGIRPLIPAEHVALLTTEKAWADGRVNDSFAWLRRNEPLALAQGEGFDPFWVATTQKDLRAISMKANLFRSGVRNIVLASQDQLRRTAELTGGRESTSRTLPQMDAPDHPRYRAIVAQYFHPQSLERLNDSVRQTARSFVDRLADFGGECDFTQDIAYRYPLRVIMSVLGVPESDEEYLLRLTHELNGPADEDIAGGHIDGTGAAEAAFAAMGAFCDYFQDMMADRRKTPRDDLISVVANARIDGEYLPDFEANSFCMVLATAGHDTTSGVTSGGVKALCDNPGLLEEVRADPTRVRAFVEESARLYPPAKMTMRTAMEDVEVNGRAIRAGEWVGLAWMSGNRDEAVFDAPNEFRLDRHPNRHVAFGNGAHVCLGQHLARLEMRNLFEQLVPRLKHVEATGNARFMESFAISGFKSLPIRYSLQ